MYNPSDIDNIGYARIISFSKLLCKREDLALTSTVNRHYPVLFYTSDFNILCYNRNV